tara:strand:- start:6793 stop:7665 length:873 start_codon:yes stop_codon:yes gene_type:complete
MSMTVSIFLMGGLGNQLFQIFAVLSYCIKYGYNLVIPYLETLNTGEIRATYWNNFLTGLKQFTNYNGELSTQYLQSFPIFRELDFTYVPFFPLDSTISNSIMFFGYFQSYKYFEETQDKIFELINLEKQKEQVKTNYYFFGEDVVSMHFRLGDYINIQDCHPLMPETYYVNALTYILGHTVNKPKTVLYFCQEQDNHIVENVISKLQKYELFKDLIFVKASDKIQDWQQMLLMSVCSHNIIANSTFSWWGAYLNTNKDKKVCYPSLWFGYKLQKNLKDLFPNEWVRIDIK